MIVECKLRGLPIPKPYDDPPQVEPWQTIFLTAWNELNEERTPGTEFVHVIPLGRKDVKGWLKWKGWHRDLDFAEELLENVKAIEAVFVPIERKRRVRLKSKTSKTPRAKPAPRARKR